MIPQDSTRYCRIALYLPPGNQTRLLGLLGVFLTSSEDWHARCFSQFVAAAKRRLKENHVGPPAIGPGARDSAE